LDQRTDTTGDQRRGRLFSWKLKKRKTIQIRQFACYKL
jgi:hypothetical protein